MPRINFARHSYQARALELSAQRCVNMYAEQAPEDAASTIVLYNTPGITALHDPLAKDPVVRGMEVMDGVLYVVLDDTLYSVDDEGTFTGLGSIDKATTPVGMAINQASPQELVIVDGAKGWTYDTTNGLREITDADFLAADTVTYQDGYFIFQKADSDQFFISNLNTGRTYTGSDIATAEGAPDLLVRPISANRRLWLLGETSTEVWFNSGDADFPFERQEFFGVGCLARWSVARIGGALAWLGIADQTGNPSVYSTEQGVPARISTPPVERAIAGYGGVSEAEAFTYGEAGHLFYVLTFPTADRTWVYDAATGLWHERESYDGGKCRARWHAYAYGRHVVGDYRQPRLGVLDEDVFQEYGDTLTFQVTSAPQYADRDRVFFRRMELFFEGGVGLTTGQGSDPQVWLDWSDDGGHTWSQAQPSRSLGAKGEYGKRVIWNRLGSGRSRVFRVTGSDPVKRSLISAHLEADGGAN